MHLFFLQCDIVYYFYLETVQPLAGITFSWQSSLMCSYDDNLFSFVSCILAGGDQITVLSRLLTKWL